MTQKLLYYEDRIQALKHSLLVERKNHHFSSNVNLHNSQLELSQISFQKEYVFKWCQDSEFDEERKQFVEKQMKEWHEMQDKRMQRIKEQQQAIEAEEKNIEGLKKQNLQEMLDERRNKINQRLKELEVA